MPARLLLATLATTLGALALTAAPALAAPEAPAVSGERATFGSGPHGPEPLDASLEGKVNPENQETSYYFEYATSEAALGTVGATKKGFGLIAPNIFGEQAAGPIDLGGGLEKDTTYYYRVVATNATGKTEGLIQHFTTIEAPLTKPATAVTGTTATLNGELNPNLSATADYHFTYYAGYNPPGTPGFPAAPCEGAGEVTTTPLAPQVIGQGVAVSEEVTGLEGNTEYTFCAGATSAPEATETLQGASKTFVTAAIAAKVESESAEGVTPSGATLEAKVNPENQRSTSCVFEYGKTSVSEHSTPCSPAEVEGSGDVTVTASLSGLAATTIYKYRALVANKSGNGEGENTFETATPPPAEKPSIGFGPLGLATGPTEALAEAFVNPGNQETSCVLLYGTEASLAHNTKTIPCEPAELTEAGLPKVTLTGLTPGTTYYFSMILENATTKEEGTPVEGPGAGEPAGELTTPTFEKPVIESESASASPFEATLEAKVNPEYQKTTRV